LSIEWGFGATPEMALLQPEKERRECGAGSFEDRLLAFGAVLMRGLFYDVVSKPGAPALYFACPYHDTVPAAWLFDPEMADTVDRLLRDRIVLIGADLPWLADNFETPLLGKEPGVAFHAMALDNMIENGAEARRKPRELFYGLDVADLIEAALIFLASIVTVVLLQRTRYTRAGLAACWASGAIIVVGGCLLAAVLLQFPMLNVVSVGLGALVASWVASTRANVIHLTEGKGPG
jgi:hypothetical protein